MEAYRLRQQGLSDVRIALRLGVSAPTVAKRLKNYQPPAPAKPAPTLEPQRASLLAEMAEKLRAAQPAPGPARAPRPTPTPVVTAAPKPEPEPPPAPLCGLDTVANATWVWLVRSEHLAKQVRSYEQRAISVERWHPSHSDQVKNVARILVLVHPPESAEDAAADRIFVESIVNADLGFREKCAITRGDIHFVCKWAMHQGVHFVDRDHMSDLTTFEETNRFEPIPHPNEAKAIDALCRWIPPEPPPYTTGDYFPLRR